MTFYIKLIYLGKGTWNKTSKSMHGSKDFVVLDYDRAERSGVLLNSQTMERMSLDFGESIFIKGNNGKEASWKVYPDDEVPIIAVGMNWLTQDSMQVRVGDFVSVTSPSVQVLVNSPSANWEPKINRKPNTYIPKAAIKQAWRKIWFFDRGYYLD